MKADGGEPKGVDGFYQHMADHGLRYGEEFRPIRELFAGDGKSAGRVSLSEAVAARVQEYALHPVLFDGALQVLSAGAKTVEDRKTGMKLPVRFARILFLRSPGAASLVRAAVTAHSDQFMEGRIGIYDEAGAPCVLVDGFRAISVAGARRSGNSGGTRNVLYHPTWERSAATAPHSRRRTRAVDPAASDRHRRDRAGARCPGPRQPASGGSRRRSACRRAGGARFARDGALSKAGTIFSVETLQVAEPMRASFGRLAGYHLVKRGLLEKVANGYRPTAAFDAAADSAPELLRAYIGRTPGTSSRRCFARRIAPNSAPSSAVKRTPSRCSSPGRALICWTNSTARDSTRATGWPGSPGPCGPAAEGLPEGRGLRILEVGAGTGGLAAQVLPLLERGVHTYTFSDVSAAFFSAAAQKLASYPEVEFKMLNLEKPGIEQGFDAESFDLIIGTNVIHAVSDLRSALRNIHTLLAPGGSLVFMDVANPQLWTDSVFGLTAGWWRFTDRDLRTQHPLLGRAQWEAVLKESDFEETASIPGLPGSEGEGQIGLFARKSWSDPAVSSGVAASPAETSWLILADEAGEEGKVLAARLQADGVRCRVARRGTSFAVEEGDHFRLRAEAPEDWDQLVQACSADAPLERIVYLWGLDEPSSGVEGGAALMGADALFHLAKSLGGIKPPVPMRLDLVTRGAQPAGQRCRGDGGGAGSADRIAARRRQRIPEHRDPVHRPAAGAFSGG